jgi:hypothetical protein
MRLIQFVTTEQQRAVALVLSITEVQPLLQVQTVYQLAQLALSEKKPLQQLVTELTGPAKVDYQAIVAEGRLLAPFDHPDPAHLLVTGTGLTHLGSADTRASMHAQSSNKTQAELTDTMKMFTLGLEGGKPATGQIGVQPEWFYKGNGSIVVKPGASLLSPAFALDGGEEPEIVGVYINDAGGQPWRIGFALGNEFSDHKTERLNYLYLAHSKLRPCAFGPELLLGDLPAHIEGHSRIYRDGKLLWQKAFVSGEDNMSHSINNLEYHHFKYHLFCRPGDAHLHYFGTATLSFGEGIEPREGDEFEIEAAVFGMPLRNSLKRDNSPLYSVKIL